MLLDSFLSGLDGLQARSGKAFGLLRFFEKSSIIGKGLITDKIEGPGVPFRLQNKLDAQSLRAR